MIRKLVCAVFVMTLAVGFVLADEFQATITKVDGNKITYQKYKKGAKGAKGGKGEKDGDPVTIAVASDAKIAKGAFDKDSKKFAAGDAIEGGLKADVFKNATEEKGVPCRITTNDGNTAVTQILTAGFGGKKKKGTN